MWTALLLLLPGAAVDFEAARSDGTRVQGELRELTPDAAVLRTSTGDVTSPVTQLERLAPAAATTDELEPTDVAVQLVDDSRIDVARITASAGKAKLVFGPGIESTAPLADIRWIRFRELEGKLNQQWETIVKSPPAADLIVIREEGSLDYLEGLIGDITADTVEFTVKGEKIPVPVDNVQGLIYYHAQSSVLAPAVCVAVERGGSTIHCAAVGLSGDKLTLRSPAGVDFSLPFDRLSHIDFPTQFLSDLKYEVASFESLVREPQIVAARVAARYRPRFNRAIESGPLRLGNREYSKGIALHSRSEVSFLLDPAKAFSKFTAVVGIDDRVRPYGNVELVIHGDERELFRQTLKGDQDPLPISLDVTGVARLKIIADFGDDRVDAADFVDLCDPRLFK